jgi:hypothetical protein
MPLAPRAAADPIVSPGTLTTVVPSYLCSAYWFPTSLCPLAPDELLLPVEISGAIKLQSWQFDLLFDNTVVQEVDSLPDGFSGIYGAEFSSGDLGSLSFIDSGFPFNFLGQVAAAAGHYPLLLSGPSGNGLLAFILFECVDVENCSNPNFSIPPESVTIVQGAPEPATLLLLASGLVLVGGRRLFQREQRN